MKTIIVVDDNPSILVAVKMLLGRYFGRVITLSSPNTVINAIREEKADVVLLDMNFSAGINTGNEGLFWLSEIKSRYPNLPVILFTAYADIGLAVRGIKEGASDFIVKPWDNDRMVETLLKYTSPRQASATLAATTGGGMYWGDSEGMRQLRSLVEKVSCTDANILLTGENGTGKELLAREIHALSNRRGCPMVAVDMGAITETLFESELFGHVKGAFTDARAARAGKFEAANGGTLFLDEIGNLPFHLQAKLLAALQNRSIVRVGSNSPIEVDIRLVSATNKDLQQMVDRSLFREDLLYRINTIRLEIPPLRKRPGDIAPLSAVFLARYAAAYGKPALRLSDTAIELLAAQSWYGNIRELQHTIEKAVIISDGDTIEASSFDFPAKKDAAQPSNESTTLEEMEYNMIRNAMNTHKGNLSLVAAQLGISRQTLYNKIKRYEL
ncbi:MAG: sigma-54 dependent transcriptional regulator [Tannerellaceae bacterium]|jgi:DNA-binding NtrC family response regulator|nr:sigma-54 dependent transcriptional regulator [Tannerellaceae bacterium]